MSSARSTPRLVGRGDEVATLVAAWERAADGDARVILVGGEAGVGKSRLVAELAEPVGAHDGLLLIGATPSRGSVAQPFAPLTSALRNLLRTLDRAEADRVLGAARTDLARLLPELAPDGGGPGPFDQLSSEPGRLFQLVHGVLDRLSARRAVVLAFEDLHWAEPSTLGLVEFLARNLDGMRVLLLLTYRTDELHRSHPLRPVLAELRRLPAVGSITLDPLSRAEVAELAADLGGAPIDDDALDRLAARSSGLPFFVEELMAWSACADATEVPLSLQEVLQLRVDGLGPPVVEVVRALGAGTTTGPVDDRLLGTVTGLGAAEIAARVRDAVAHQVLVVDECGIDFRHALAREVVEADLLPSERTALHAAFASGLEADARAADDPTTSARIARHWTEANEPEAAAAWSLRAGRAARRAYAYAEAADHHQRVLAWWDHLQDPATVVGASRLMVAAEAATSLDLDERASRARGLIEAELAHDDRSPDPTLSADDRSDGRAALYALLGRIMRSSGDGQASIDVLRGALGTFTGRASAHRTRVRVELAHALALSGRREEAVVEAEQALAEAVETGDRATIGRATHVFGHELAMAGETERGLRLLREAIQAAIDTDDVDWVSRGYINLSDVLRLLGRHDEAIETALAGDRFAASRGTRCSAFARMNAVESMIPLGRLDQARELTDDTPEDDTHMGAQHMAATRSWLKLREGETDGVADALTELERATEREDNPQFEGTVARNRLELAWLIGERVDPWPIGRRVVERRLGTDAAQAQPEILALIARLEADRALDPACSAAVHDEARHGLDRVGDLAEDLSAQRLATMAPALAEALVRGERARAGVAATTDAWDRVIDAAIAAQDPWHEAYGRWRAAEHLAAEGRDDAARSPAAEARRLAASMHAGGLTARIDAFTAGARLGSLVAVPLLPEPHDDEAVAAVDDDPLTRLRAALGLTHREAEVLALVAQGKTNGEIGDALYISTKTASVHVSNILAKLGASTRTQAAAIALRAVPA